MKIRVLFVIGLYLFCCAGAFAQEQAPAADEPASTPTNVLDLLPADSDKPFDQSIWAIHGQNNNSFTFWRAKRLEDGGLICILNTGYNGTGFYSQAQWVYAADGRLTSYRERCAPANSAYRRDIIGVLEGDEFVLTRSETAADQTEFEPVVTRLPAEALEPKLSHHQLPLIVAYHHRQGNKVYACQLAGFMPQSPCFITRFESQGDKAIELGESALSGELLSVHGVEADPAGTSPKPRGQHSRWHVMVDQDGGIQAIMFAMRCGVEWQRTSTADQVAEAFGLEDVQAMEQQSAGEQ